MSPNQTVAANLRRAREYRGLTQKQAAEAISRQGGARWSPESYAQAERAAHGRRARRFDADELAAFAKAFNLPVTFFIGGELVNPSELGVQAAELRHVATELRRTAGELDSLAGTFSTTARAIRQGPGKVGGPEPASWHGEGES